MPDIPQYIQNAIIRMEAQSLNRIDQYVAGSKREITSWAEAFVESWSVEFLEAKPA